MNRRSNFLFCFRMSLLGMILVGLMQSSLARAQSPNPVGEWWFPKWKVLQGPGSSSSWNDIFSAEWEYIQVHQGSQFLVVGFVLVNPKGVGGTQSRFLPTGLNLAVITQGDPLPLRAKMFNYPLESLSLRPDAFGIETRGAAGMDLVRLFKEKPISGEETLRVIVQNQEVTVDLSLGLREGSGQGNSAVVGSDIGYFPFENWTVNMLGLSSEATGSVQWSDTSRFSFSQSPAYRERSHGKYTFLPDGWDFHVIQFPKVAHHEGMSVGLQTYHKSKALDYAEIQFWGTENQAPERFSVKEGTLSWQNQEWVPSASMHQCTPQKGTLTFSNPRWEMLLDFELPPGQETALNSDLTPLVERFSIDYRFLVYQGTLLNKVTGEKIQLPPTQGIGEFSFARALGNLPNVSQCQRWGKWFNGFFVKP